MSVDPIARALAGQAKALAEQAGGGGSGQPWYFAPPVAADFPDVYGTPTWTVEDDADVGLIIAMGALGTGVYPKFAAKAIPSPSADWSTTARVTIDNDRDDYSGFGLFMTLAATPSKCIAFYLDGGGQVQVGYFQIPNGNDGKYVQKPMSAVGQGTLWLRITHIAATSRYRFWVSHNGKQFALVSTDFVDTEYLGAPADRIGLGFWMDRGYGYLGNMACDAFTTSF